LQKFLADGKLDDSEKQQLESLAAEYGFSKDELRDAHKKAASLRVGPKTQTEVKVA
jgi:predicted DNA-binding helix-hairpin-helix protein